jgi:hypothetical protein
MPSLKPLTSRKEHVSKDYLCNLITQVRGKDKLQQDVVLSETKEETFCAVGTITQTEYGISSREGFMPAKLIIIDYDTYDFQKELEFEDTRYTIYRTFVKEDGDIELYCEVRVGNGKR